ncbi:unannotated protein [freshwater metagenome]|uniref:Unannotated protein n=1 Tax=freshwater metagenome TaxID=449393 RepID=A0A6J7N0W9_9ZZZZ
MLGGPGSAILAGKGIGTLGIASDLDGFDAANNFAANGWGEFSPGGYGFAAMVIVEIIDELD